MKPAAVPTERKIPSLTDVSPEYAIIVGKTAELREEDDRLEVEHIAIVNRLNANQLGARRATEIQVDALLADKPVADAAISGRERLTQIDVRRTEIRRMLSELTLRASHAIGPASALVCKVVRAEYDHHLQAAARALIEAHAHFLIVIDLVTKIEQTGATAAALGNVRPYLLGDPRDPQSSLAYFFNEAAKANIIKADEVPAEYTVQALNAYLGGRPLPVVEKRDEPTPKSAVAPPPARKTPAGPTGPFMEVRNMVLTAGAEFSCVAGEHTFLPEVTARDRIAIGYAEEVDGIVHASCDVSELPPRDRRYDWLRSLAPSRAS